MTERPISFVVSDVDATQIIPGRGGIPTPAVQAAARGLRANGIPLLEATSRSHALMAKIIKPLDLRDNLCALDGGATIAHADSGNVVWSRWLKAETVRTVVSSIGGLCTGIHYDIDTCAETPAAVMARAARPDQLRNGAPSVFAIFEATRAPEIVGALAKVRGINKPKVMSYDEDDDMRCIQVLDPRVDKRSGVREMLRRAGLLNKRGLVVGDNTNDLALFRAVSPDSVRVAMGNACTELKERADHVTASVWDDGFAVATRHYDLW